MSETSGETRRAFLLAELHRRFLADPGSVEPGWREVFESLDEGARAWLAGIRDPDPAPAHSPGGTPSASAADSVAAMALIRAYRQRAPLEFLLSRLEAHSEAVFRRRFSLDSRIFALARRGYFFLRSGAATHG